MLPNNVMSFMKKMVATNEGPGPGAETGTDSGTALSKLRQTLSSSLMTAQDKVTKSVIRQPEASTPPEPVVSKSDDVSANAKTNKADVKPASKAGACRVCLKSFKPDDYSRICFECHQKVCEDCASYYKQDENQDDTSWRCSICRRKMQSRAQPVLAQDSTDSLLDVPVLEALQRRHSDVKIGSSSLAVSSGPSGLAPPRSPELRRHSDVSPVSLKELEKARERELQWRQHKREGGTSGQGGSPVGSRATSPSVERRAFVGEDKTNVEAQRQREQRTEPAEGEDNGDSDNWRRQGSTMANRRRKSRVQKQHSYDDELKNNAPAGTPEVALGLPAQLPRRASAYDVFMAQGRGGGDSSPVVGRRSSFRAVPPPEPEETTVSPDNNPSLLVEEERRTRRRGSQLPDIAALRSLPPTSRATAVPDHVADTVRRQPSVQDGEAIKIVIHDVDCDPNISSRTGSKRRVTLRRDPSDKAHRTRGFGMRVVGGKSGADGRLFAYIVWTVPGGPAEKGGLQQGDKVLEWGGVSLTDRSFEEVCTIMDRTGDMAELVVEHGTDLRMCDLLDEPMPSASRKNSGEAVGLQLSETDLDKSPASPTRRKLPKTPEQIAKERVPVSGRIQLQVFYHDEKNELVVSVFAADDLAPRDDTGFGTIPEAYVQLRLLPFTGDQVAVKTEVSEPSQCPIWNTTLEIGNVSGEQLMDKSVEVTLWDYRPDKEQVFLGECAVDLTKALVDDRPVWYRLEDPRQLRSGKMSPRSSLASELTARLLRKDNRSFSEEKDSDAEGGELGGFLHPDHAYIAGSRRGSSQSEQLEVETYQLNKDFSRSLPGSRRSSFQSAGQNAEKDPEVPPPSYKERRRSSCTPRRDPDEILRSLKAVKGELLGRSMSISVDKRGSRRGAGKDGRGRKGSMIVGSEKREPLVSCSSPSDEEDKWSTKSEAKPLGPGQIQPRGHRVNPATQAELKISLLMTKGQLEVEVICARGIQGELPDTYVKTYLRDGERWLQKRKTRAVRHSCEPQFNQTLRYSACDVLGRSLVVMLWEKQKGFEHNVGLGGAELALDAIKLTQLTVGWYPLFPIQTLGSDSNDSP